MAVYSLTVQLLTFRLQAVETESLLKPILSAEEFPGAYLFEMDFFYDILESWWKLYIAMHSLLNVMLLCYVHIYNLKIIFWMADMLLFMVTEVHILSFMNTILITEELYICLFKSFYKFGFFFLLFCYFICFICLILPLYSLFAWNLQKEPRINSRIWSEAHEEIACSFLLWFTNRWRSN